MIYIDNLRDLDKELDHADSQFKVSDDSGRRALDHFCYTINKKSLPANPYSNEYHDFQMELYLKISGRGSYDIKNESTEFNIEDAKKTPFPYSTHSASTVGDQLLAIGYIIKKMNLSPGSSVVEFGPGWGNMTLALCQMGHNITCVEVENGFIDLIKYRTNGLSGPIEFFNTDMLDFVLHTNNKYDAVIFFESFHHCSSPFQLLEHLSNLLSDDGIVCFAAEPLVYQPSIIVPYPWGVRLDGLSLWSIRRSGWMELGFEASFFIKTLMKYGFDIHLHSSDVSPLAQLIIAKKTKNPDGIGSMLNPMQHRINACKVTYNKLGMLGNLIK